MNTSLAISDISIRQDSNGRFCLNDLHKASGDNPKNKPSEWLRNKQTTDLIELLDSEQSIAGIPAIFTKQGLGTYAVKELVYAYAMWISAKFHITVIRAYDALVTGQTQYGLKALPAIETLTPAQKRWVQERVNYLSHNQVGTKWQTLYHDIKTKFKVGTYSEIPSARFSELCRFLGCEPPTQIELLPVQIILTPAELEERIAEAVKQAHLILPPVQRISSKQKEQLYSCAKSVTQYCPRKTASMWVINGVQAIFGISSLDNLPSAKFDAALAHIKSKEEQCRLLTEVLTEIGEDFCKRILSDGAPYLGDIKRKHLAQYQEKLIGEVNWIEIIKRLKQ